MFVGGTIIYRILRSCNFKGLSICTPCLFFVSYTCCKSSVWPTDSTLQTKLTLCTCNGVELRTTCTWIKYIVDCIVIVSSHEVNTRTQTDSVIISKFIYAPMQLNTISSFLVIANNILKVYDNMLLQRNILFFENDCICDEKSDICLVKYLASFNFFWRINSLALINFWVWSTYLCSNTVTSCSQCASIEIGL